MELTQLVVKTMSSFDPWAVGRTAAVEVSIVINKSIELFEAEDVYIPFSRIKAIVESYLVDVQKDLDRTNTWKYFWYYILRMFRCKDVVILLDTCNNAPSETVGIRVLKEIYDDVKSVGICNHSISFWFPTNEYLQEQEGE